MILYVAGPYSCDPVPDAFANMRRGTRVCAELIMEGIDAFCPWADWILWMTLRDGETIPKERIYAYSMAFLEVSDAVYVLDRWERSPGTKKEIIRAQELGIPVFYEKHELMAWVRKETGE